MTRAFLNTLATRHKSYTPQVLSLYTRHSITTGAQQ